MTRKDLDGLIESVLSLKGKAQVEDFLRGILTPQELVQIEKRLQIVKMLKLRVSQREIAEKLEVGIATVTRGSRELGKGRFKYVK